MKREDVEALRPVKMWVIAYDNGYFDPHSVCRTRSGAIAKFTDDPAGYTWDYWRKRGCRAVKVRLVAVGREG